MKFYADRNEINFEYRQKLRAYCEYGISKIQIVTFKNEADTSAQTSRAVPARAQVIWRRSTNYIDICGDAKSVHS